MPCHWSVPDSDQLADEVGESREVGVDVLGGRGDRAGRPGTDDGVLDAQEPT
jgi:hypothetical protein